MRLFIFFLVLSVSTAVPAQGKKLQPGFDPQEYAELLSLSFNGSSIADTIKRKNTKDRYTLVYRSPETGLLNRWQFFIRNDNVGVLELRGTVNKFPSWLENFYAAMIPAQGSIRLNDSTLFPYKFAENKKAMVHVGWTIGVGYMGPAIVKFINSYFSRNGVSECLIIGHSQGGALSQLMRSYLAYEQKEKRIPAAIHFKTYSSAAPKTGNLYYAYDYDFINRGGWAFTVVNSADWVPEVPFSIQTLNDFNTTNPFTDVKDILKKQKLIVRLGGRIVYNKLNRSTRKAQRRMTRYLGHKTYKAVRKELPQLQEPVYAKGNNYMRAGTPVILMADDDYYREFPENSKNRFMHHLFPAYYYLLKKYYPLTQ